MEYWKNKAFNSIEYHRRHKEVKTANATKVQCKSCWDYDQTKAVYYLRYLGQSHCKQKHPSMNLKSFLHLIPYVHYYPIDDEENPLTEPPPTIEPQQVMIPPHYYSSNKWGNQQKRNKIEIKRAFGRYYRMKENKTWKWKLRKRRRSKRRILKETHFDDAEFEQDNFGKMTQIVFTHNSSHSMTSYCHTLYQPYYEAMPLNEWRITVECHSCCSSIYINSRDYFDEYRDANGRRIYHYSIDRDKVNVNDKYLYFIYGEYRRIFCNLCCVTHQIVKCCFKDCKSKERNLPKLVTIDNDVFYGEYMICCNHKKCELCQREYSYNGDAYWELKEYAITECNQCKKYVCDECILHGICIQCIDHNQFMVLRNILSAILDVRSINIIKEYCNGHFMVQCCSLSNCARSICIKNVLSLTGDNGLYSYVARDYAENNAVHIFNQKLIIFCKQCMGNMRKCQHSDCDNKAAAPYAICQIHSICNVCGYRGSIESGDALFWGVYIHEEFTKCTDCNQYICTHCLNFDGICKVCKENAEFVKIRNILDGAVGHILNMNLIDIISFHCTADFNVKCCNLYGCDNDINIKNAACLIKGIDGQKRNIYFYEANEYGFTNAVYIYGYRLIIFCARCTKTKLKKCQYHKFTFGRSLGNDIYDKAKCYNLEASHIMCQSHPNHHKMEGKVNVDDVIKKQKKLKKAQKCKDRERRSRPQYSIFGSRYYPGSLSYYRSRLNSTFDSRLTPVTSIDYKETMRKYKIYKKIKIKSSFKRKYKTTKREKETDALLKGDKRMKKKLNALVARRRR